jgi:hypothetical protein
LTMLRDGLPPKVAATGFGAFSPARIDAGSAVAIDNSAATHHFDDRRRFM